MACAVDSATATNSAPIAVLATTATWTFEATVLVGHTELMAQAGWLLLGSPQGAACFADGRRWRRRLHANRVLTKDGEVGGCEVSGETVVCGGGGVELWRLQVSECLSESGRGDWRR